MKAFVDKDICIGCGACEAVCSDVFEIDTDGLAVAIESEISADLVESAQDACDGCPVDAISLND